MPYARISATLPTALLAAADRRAKQLDRSRSWLIAHALSAYLTGEPGGGRSTQARDAAPSPYAAPPGLGEQRLAQLRNDLALTPEQRVLEAEQTARAVTPCEAPWTGVLTFERFEDYLAWKRREAIGR